MTKDTYSINVRFPRNMEVPLKEAAQGDDRSVSNYIVVVLRDHLNLQVGDKKNE